MKAYVAASGRFGVPVAEDLVKACWGIETLYYDPATAPEFDHFRRQVSFPVEPVKRGWDALWSTLKPAKDAMLFLIGAPDPQRLPPFKAVYSLQAGLLPSQAGPDAAAWAIASGEKKTGVTLYRRVDGPYAGELLFSEECAIADADDAGTVETKQAALAVKVVREFWETSTKAQLRPLSTLAGGTPRGPWIGGAIPWTKSARQARDFVRASARPGAGAWSYVNGRKLTVWKASPAKAEGRARPGTVISTDPFRVAAGDGALRLDRVQPEGEKEQSGTEFARTRGIEAGLTLTAEAKGERIA